MIRECSPSQQHNVTVSNIYRGGGRHRVTRSPVMLQRERATGYRPNHRSRSTRRRGSVQRTAGRENVRGNAACGLTSWPGHPGEDAAKVL